MKQKMIKGLGVAAALALLVGCNEINFSGLFSITAPITFAQQGKAVLTVNPGQFQTKASLGQSGSQKQIKLEISNTNPPTKVQLNFDKNINIGEHFSLTAAQIGQNFDLAGDLATSVQDSPEYSGSESCTYQATQTV
jgi:LAS superfamily LD-carboxypeptidase LdcB